MTPQTHTPPTTLARSGMVFGSSYQAHVTSDTAGETLCARVLSTAFRLHTTTNTAVADDVALVNPICSNAARITSLIEVERRGAEREAQVQTVTESMRDLTTDCTEARTPRTARPAFTRRPLSTMTSTTNTPLRRASGDLRSLH